MIDSPWGYIILFTPIVGSLYLYWLYLFEEKADVVDDLDLHISTQDQVVKRYN